MLRYTSPAARFEEALPVGAGRFGAMVYGVPDCETLRLNEDSVWSGGKRDRINPDAREGFTEVRALLMQGEIQKAEALAFQKMQGCGPNMPHYMPLGDLTVRLSLPEGEVCDYVRTLDLSEAAASVSFTVGGHSFRREIIASYPDQCLLVRLTGDVPFSAQMTIDGRDDYYDRNCILRTQDCRRLLYTGASGGKNGISFCAMLHADADAVTSFGNTLCASGCDILLLFAVRTDYYHPDCDLQAMVSDDLDKASALGWDALRARHIRDYSTLYGKCSISLPCRASDAERPTDQLLSALQNGDDSVRNFLLMRYFDFGRYLMISGSRPGSLPLNLQGIWNVDMWPAWGCRFTVNINTQMNYWPAEVCGLGECHLPLFALLERVAENGRITAEKMYGARGFCCHHNTDLWGDTAPQDLWMPATLWPTGGAWLSLHILMHFAYTRDMDFLRRYYPILHEAAQFFADTLTENAQGQLVTCPSVSPENTYITETGARGSLCAGPSMDSQILYELFTGLMDAHELIAASADTDTDDPLIDNIKTILQKLPVPKIGKYGQIMEWAVDYDEAEPGHRHISQLFALHPGHQISPRKTPALAKAAADTLTRRLTYGGGHTGWSCAWIANMFARLHDADSALATLDKLLTHSTNPNLFDMHPPFQIDGNFGGTAAIAECLMQSDGESMTLLPALPAAWNTGSFTGLRAEGGFSVSARWENGQIVSASVDSGCGGVCKIYGAADLIPHEVGGTVTAYRKEADGAMSFETVCGGSYRLNREP